MGHGTGKHQIHPSSIRVAAPAVDESEPAAAGSDPARFNATQQIGYLILALRVAGLLDRTGVRPAIGLTLPLAESARGFQAMLDRTVTGKIVFTAPAG